MSRKVCSVEGCSNSIHGKGLCGKHYQRMWKHGDPTYQPKKYATCIVDGCNRGVRSSGSLYCEKHYGRIRRNGTTDRQAPSQKINHSHGYVLRYVPGHPLLFGSTRSYEYEHRVVYYDVYGEGPFSCRWCNNRLTWDTMHIDHLNDFKKDNRIENLVASCPVCNQKRGRAKMKKTMKEKHGTWLEIQGQRMHISDWAKRLGIRRTTLVERIRSGWSLERALTEAKNNTGPKV